MAMTRGSGAWAAAALALALAAGPAWSLEKGQAAPDFSLPSAEGKLASLKDLSGNVVALSFWASWGKQCAEELKLLQGLVAEFEGKGLVALAVNEREERDRAQEFAERLGVTYPVLLDDGSVARLFGVNGVPDLWIVDRRGVVRARFLGFGPTVPKDIREAVVAALAGAPPSAGPGAAGAEDEAAVPAQLRAYAHLQVGAAHVNIGDAFVKAGYRDGGHFEEAMRELTAGVALDPRSVELRIWLGVSLERTRDRAGAIREYQTALLLDPGNVYAQDALRRLGVPPAPAAE